MTSSRRQSSSVLPIKKGMQLVASKTKRNNHKWAKSILPPGLPLESFFEVHSCWPMTDRNKSTFWKKKYVLNVLLNKMKWICGVARRIEDEQLMNYHEEQKVHLEAT